MKANSNKSIKMVLSVGDVMMIEADIILGTLIDDPSNLQPVMGHPPAQTSDISLQQFLQRINEFNAQTTVSKKGVKLDFKSIEVFEMSLHIIENLYQKVTFTFNSKFIKLIFMLKLLIVGVVPGVD